LKNLTYIQFIPNLIVEVLNSAIPIKSELFDYEIEKSFKII